MKIYKLKKLALILLSTFFFQCSSDPELIIEQNKNEQAVSNKAKTVNIDPEIEMKFGAILENPYSVANMQKAFNSLKTKQQGFDKISITIKANYLYIRALPKDESELDYLKDLGYELYEYPLDREIIQEGSYYVDPEIGEGKITWQYFVVPVGFEYPNNIQYEG